MGFNILTEAADLDINVWRNFVTNHPNGNIFHSPDMFVFYSHTSGFNPVIVVLTNKEGAILGLVTGVIQYSKSRFLKPFTSRCIVLGGPLVKDNSLKVADLLIKTIVKQVTKKTIYIQFRNLWLNENLDSVFVMNRFNFENHLDIHIDLKQPREILWGSIKSNARNKIRKAEINLKLRIINTEQDVRKAYKILEHVYSRIGLPLADEKLFLNAFYYSLESKAAIFFGAFSENELIGIRVILKFENSLYDWYAGSKESFTNSHPNDFLVWKIIEWGSENGFSVFDFGGAGKPDEKYGVRDYKMKFGGELKSLGRYTRVNSKSKMHLGEIGINTLKYYRKFRHFKVR